MRIGPSAKQKTRLAHIKNIRDWWRRAIRYDSVDMAGDFPTYGHPLAPDAIREAQ